MNKALAGTLIVALIGGAIWYVMKDSDSGTASPTAQPEDLAYDFEAQDVEMSQTGADGRVQYRLQAERIAQSLESGEVHAEKLTIHHDPPGTEPGGPYRWTVTADGAELPANAEVITLEGSVRAGGIPRGRRIPAVFRTERLAYDVSRQEVSTDEEFFLDWGASTFAGNGFKVNFNTTEWAVESKGHGTFVP